MLGIREEKEGGKKERKGNEWKNKMEERKKRKTKGEREKRQKEHMGSAVFTSSFSLTSCLVSECKIALIRNQQAASLYYTNATPQL